MIFLQPAEALVLIGVLTMLVSDGAGWWAGLAIGSLSVLYLMFSRGREYV